MHKWLFLIGLLISFNGATQLPEKVKYDKLTYSYDSATVLIQKGALNSVYDCVNSKYAIDPTKSKIINFQHSNNYALIESKTKELWIYQILKGQVSAIKGNGQSCYIAIDNPSTKPQYMDMNGEKFDLHSWEISGEKTTNVPVWSQYKIEKMAESVYILNSYQSASIYTDPIGVWVYNPGFNASGVFDLELNDWMIYPAYKTCFLLNGFVLCLAENIWATYPPSDIPQLPRYTYDYDIFQLTGGKMNRVVGSATQIEYDLLAKMLQVDELVALNETGVFQVKKSDQIGLLKFSLFDESSEIQNGPTYFGLIEPKADFIFYEAAYEMAAVLFLDSVQRVRFYQVEADSLVFLASHANQVMVYFDSRYLPQFCAVAGDTFYRSNWENDDSRFLISTTEPCEKELPGLGLFYLNDSLVVLNDFVEDSYPEARESIYYPGEDSIDNNGQVVYFPQLPGYQKSGVYNLNTNEWVVDGNYVKISAGADGFLAMGAYREGENGTISGFYYSGFDLSGNRLFEKYSLNQVFSVSSSLKAIVPFSNAVEVFDAPDGCAQHTRLEAAAQSYYVRTQDGTMGVYCPDEYFENTFSDSLFEFIHYNPSEKFAFVLEGDSIYLKSVYGNFSVSQQAGKIEYMDVFDSRQDSSFQITVIEGIDTVQIGKIVPGFELLTVASIEKKGPYLIVNDHSTNCGAECLECINEDGFFYNKGMQFESENSAVWIKKDSLGWEKISPYYASIESTPNGFFIAFTGFYFEQTTTFTEGDNTLEENETPRRYLLLDSTLKVVPYLDYFDFPQITDLGFGIAIKLDNGYSFFVTYSGQPLTDASWDYFELENGKIKAVLETRYEVDEFGDVILNEYGVPTELVSGTVKYYKLP